jgi:hypothetical protein
MLVLVLGLGGCGSAEPGLRETSRLERAVRAQLEQRLMRANPREGSTSSATHVDSVECLRQGGLRYRCKARFGDGSRGDFVVFVSRDGKELRFG